VSVGVRKKKSLMGRGVSPKEDWGPEKKRNGHTGNMVKENRSGIARETGASYRKKDRKRID